MIVIDDRRRVLLLRGGDPARPLDGNVVVTPGGGVMSGESLEDAARRELREETGLDVIDLGPVVQTRDIEFSFEGQRYEQREYYFRIAVEAFEVHQAGWTDTERRVMYEARWWTVEERTKTTEIVYPEGLVDLVRNRSA